MEPLRRAVARVGIRPVPLHMDWFDEVRDAGKEERDVFLSRPLLELAVPFIDGLYGRIAAIIYP